MLGARQEDWRTQKDDKSPFVLGEDDCREFFWNQIRGLVDQQSDKGAPLANGLCIRMDDDCGKHFWDPDQRIEGPNCPFV